MSRQNHDDSRLLRDLTNALHSGDADAVNTAFEAVYNAYARSVALVCGRYLANDADVQSVTNEVFLRFFRRAVYLDGIDSLRAYLTRSARNAALDHLREQNRRLRGLADLYADRDSDGETDPLTLIPDESGDVTANARYQALVDELCAAVGKEATAVILAHAVCGESFPAIAARLGKKENTVKTIYHRAIKAYRKEKGDHPQ